MKKMLVACAALALVVPAVATATVYSSNVVGYQKLNLAGQFAMISPTLMTVGTDTWRLGDVVATGMDPFLDIVQVLDMDTAITTATYTYVDPVAAELYFADPLLVGWWDFANVGGDGGRRDHVVIAAGQGLLCNVSSPGVTFTYQGEVLDGATQVVLPGQFVVLSNFLPLDITLGQVEAVGMDPFLDIVQVLDLTTAITTATYTYVDPVAAESYFADPSLVGWWDFANVGGDGGRRDHVVIPAGSGLLSNVSSASVSFTFPDPIP